MLPGFPKTVTKKKLARGRYQLIRDDGYTVEVVHGVSEWYVGRGGKTVKSLGIAVYDMEHGFTSRDQLAARGVPVD